MPEPIEYWNPKGRSGSIPSTHPAAASGPIGAVPIEFDALLTRTTELAAAQAIISALTKLGIPFHESHDGKIADREILLYVRSADQNRAATIAAGIFARRNNIRKLLHQKPLPPTSPDNGSRSIV